MPGLMQGEDPEFTSTGTPADNFPDIQRAQFCGDGTAKSGSYVTEFHIPTECTQPLAITSDFGGNIWYMQTNTGNVGKFDPASGTFSEFENPAWPPGGRSMVWGMDYSSDNSVWYSDEAYDSVWRFSIDDEEYQRFDFPSEGNSLPQRLEIDGSQILINDFTGNKLTVMDASAYSQDAPHVSIPSPVGQSVTAGFAKDSNSNLWYANWIPDAGGVLVRLDYDRYSSDLPGAPAAGLELAEYVETFSLPPQAAAINGVAVGSSGSVWLTDTATSNFYEFDPSTEAFTEYITSPVSELSYGNHTGLIKTNPLSRPYWVGLDSLGQVIFNEQTANRIGVFDPQTEKLTEYSIPSMNHLWSDCGTVTECGLAQAFDFTVVGDKIWFTQWVTNNIGVIDTSVAPEIDVSLPVREVRHGENSAVTMHVTSNTDSEITLVSNSATGGISLSPGVSTIGPGAIRGTADSVSYDISVSEELAPGKYKVLVGAQTSEIAVSQFFTLVVG